MQDSISFEYRVNKMIEQIAASASLIVAARINGATPLSHKKEIITKYIETSGGPDFWPYLFDRINKV